MLPRQTFARTSARLDVGLSTTLGETRVGVDIRAHAPFEDERDDRLPTTFVPDRLGRRGCSI